MRKGIRFTAYFTAREDKALERAAKLGECSRNYIVRTAVRAYLGLDNMTQMSQLSRVDDNRVEDDV